MHVHTDSWRERQAERQTGSDREGEIAAMRFIWDPTVPFRISSDFHLKL